MRTATNFTRDTLHELPYKPPVNFLRQYRFILLFFALLVFCSVMIIRQYTAKPSLHFKRREAFVLLHARGYTNEAGKIYHKLLLEVPELQTKELFEDFQRTLMLVDPYTSQTNNLIYNYHWMVSHELDKRGEEALREAKKLAEEK
jgi:hypothetical protein